MFFKKRSGPTPQKWENHKDSKEEKEPNDLERFERSFFQIGSVIKAHLGLPRILTVLARESLAFLKAGRATIFLIDKESGTLQKQYTYASDLADKEVNLVQEKEIASHALKQRRPLCLRRPEDFSDFAKYEDSKRKIASLLSIPLFSQGEPVGILSLVLTDEKRSFDDKNLRCLTIFGNQASLAIENAHLLEDVGKEIRIRKTFEQYLDHILQRLEGNSEKTSQPVEDHIGKVRPAQIGDGDSSPKYITVAKISGGNGAGTKVVESSINELGSQPPRGKEMRVESGDAVSVADDRRRVGSAGLPAP